MSEIMIIADSMAMIWIVINSSIFAPALIRAAKNSEPYWAKILKKVFLNLCENLTFIINYCTIINIYLIGRIIKKICYYYYFLY